MAGKGKVAVRELGENLIRLSRVGDLSGIKDLLDTQEDHDFVAAAVNFREQKVWSFAYAEMVGFRSLTVFYCVLKERRLCFACCCSRWPQRYHGLSVAKGRKS